MRILVIDDDAPMRETLRAILEKAGYEVVEAGDGRAGLSRQREQPVQLVITDIIMPGMEGMEAIAEFQESFPDVPLIAISGGSRSGVGCYLETAEALGACCSLPKPFGRSELLDAVARALSGDL